MGDGKKKLFQVLITLVIALIIMVGGTYAWSDEKQHKTNVIHGKGNFYDVTLIEDFKSIDDWKVSDDPIKKEIRVKNGSDKEPVFIRLSLKEFMEVSKYEDVYSDQALMIDQHGEFVSFKSKGDAETYLKDSELDNEIVEYDASGSSLFYLVDELGMPLLLERKELAPEPIEELVSLYPDIKNLSSEALVSHHNQEGNKECEGYPVHEWDKDKLHAESPFLKYVTWHMGKDVMTMDEYLEYIADKDVEDYGVDQWILDTSSPFGYVYWGNPLEVGKTTSNLLEKIELVKQPHGSFFYEVHVDMDSVNHESLNEWLELPEVLKQAWNVK